MGKRVFAYISAVFLLVLAACNNQSTSEQMYEHLEEAVALEEAFAEQQQPLVELEQREKEIYNEIINLGMEEFDQVEELSQEAISIIDEREEKLKTEKQSIEDAKEEFDKAAEMVDELEEEEVKGKAEEMVSTMNDRYQAYQDLNESYTSALEQDRTLYELLQNQELKEEELRKQIDTINNQYDEVISANQSFNDYTEQYNQLKQSFYEAAGIDVEYDEATESGETEE